MIALSEIRRMNREAAEENARLGKRPFEMYISDFQDALQGIEQGRAPSLEWPKMAPEHVEEFYPGEYELVETFFVDKGQFNLHDAGGPALSVYRLMLKGVELTTIQDRPQNLFWTIHDEGQFQVYVSAFRQVRQPGMVVLVAEEPEDIDSWPSFDELFGVEE